AETPHWSEKLVPHINQALMHVMPAINAWAANQMAEARARRAGATRSSTVDVDGTETTGHETAMQAEPVHAEQLAAAVAAASSPGRGVDLMKLLQLLPPETSAKLMKIQAAVSLEEQADAMRLLKGYLAEDLQDLLTTFDAASLDECI